MPKKPFIEQVAAYLEKRDFENLSALYQRSRATGNTEAVMKVAQECGGIVVFALHNQAADAEKRWPGVRCVSVMNSQKAWGGEPGPILFDNSAWPMIFGRLDEADRLMAGTKEALETIEQVRRSMMRLMDIGGGGSEG